MYHETARAIVVDRRNEPKRDGVSILCAGTADLPVADECDAVLGAHGVVARRLTDVGVAGIHRLLASLDAFDEIRRRLPGLVTTAEPAYLQSNFINGIKRLPVRW